MRRLRIGILDLVTKSPKASLYGRLMNANLASIMPQVIGVWCEQEGHDVTLVCYTGLEDLLEELPADLDVLFIGAFTQSAQLAYALSNLFRPPRRRDRARRAARPLLSRGLPQILRLRPGLHRPRASWPTCCRDCQPHRPLGRAHRGQRSRWSCRRCGSGGSSPRPRSRRRRPSRSSR